MRQATSETGNASFSYALLRELRSTAWDCIHPCDPGGMHCLDGNARRSLSRAAAILHEEKRELPHSIPEKVLLPVYV